MSQPALKTAQVISLRRAPAPVPVLEPGRGDRLAGRRLLAFLAASAALHLVLLQFSPTHEPIVLVEPPPLRVTLAEPPPMVPEMKPEPRPPEPAAAPPPPRPRPAPKPEPAPASPSVAAPPAVEAPAPEPPPLLTAPSAGHAPEVAAPQPEPPRPAPVTPPVYNAAYLSNPPPPYPVAARRRGQEGVVLLSVLVSEAGLPKEIKLARSSGAPVLDEAALEAVKGWKFVPARQGERSVAAWVEVPIRFRLENR
jgi:protein TonB